MNTATSRWMPSRETKPIIVSSLALRHVRSPRMNILLAHFGTAQLRKKTSRPRWTTCGTRTDGPRRSTMGIRSSTVVTDCGRNCENYAAKRQSSREKWPCAITLAIRARNTTLGCDRWWTVTRSRLRISRSCYANCQLPSRRRPPTMSSSMSTMKTSWISALSQLRRPSLMMSHR